MTAFKYILKSILWSAVVSVGIRIVFGLYSVFGAPTLFIPIIAGIIAAISLSPTGTVGFVAASLSHIILITALTVFWDVSGIFRTLASESADFFAKIAGTGDGRVNILWCILFVTPIYFISYVISSSIVSSVRRRRYEAAMEERYDEYYDKDEKELRRH